VAACDADTHAKRRVLTTAGGLVVTGDWDRYLYTHDASPGKVLFKTRMPTSVQGFPITYAVNGKQYLAVPVGSGRALFNMPAHLVPSRRVPPPGNAIFVFALPD
jgi:alcohol dehydrogenase (cytochrome c)